VSRVLVAPSILAADFGRLAEETRRMEQAGADWIHLDVMDGHFVPNLTIGPQVVQALRPVTKLPLDVHLMVENPERYIPIFVKAGANRVTVHAEAVARGSDATRLSVEAVSDLVRIVRRIHGLGVKVGVALRPQTGMEVLKPCLGEMDLALLMTVNPGFGGQSFMPEVLPKIEALRKVYGGHIQVDGGINEKTAASTRAAGADVMVAGTYLFRAPDPKQAIASLRGES
jgi:ribulose-phosphate 3-epimerase